MKYVHRDPDQFHPNKNHAFTHSLSDHPLFKFEELKKLAMRHPTIRYHSSRIPRYQRLDRAVQECPNGHSLEETLDHIETSGSFVFIMDVQNDTLYAPLVQEILDELEDVVHRHHRGMRKRQAWIFITSPGGTTPYHRDHESSHYFHIKGKKRLWLWDHNDREVVSQLENETFHGVHSLQKTSYRDSLMEKASEYNLSPGHGAYFPYTAPHLVENNDQEYSISFSVTHMTDENYAEKRINKVNQLLRRFGLNPNDLGASALVDQMKLLFFMILKKFVFSGNKDWIGT